MSRPSAKHPIVTFWRGDVEYGFDVFDVVELTPGRAVTPLPAVGTRVVGVAAWRGKTIPVADLGQDLKDETGNPDERKRLLVLSRPGPFAVLVDRPGRVLPREELSTFDIDRDARDSSLILGVVRTRRGMIRVLDPALVIGEGA